jgi:hypothetical protein
MKTEEKWYWWANEELALRVGQNVRRETTERNHANPTHRMHRIFGTKDS